MFLDFQKDTTADDRIFISILVPIFTELDRRPLGVLAIRIDPEVYLFPYINQWPVPSNTAETLLVRREGGDVLFLNRLRFMRDAALNLNLMASIRLAHATVPGMRGRRWGRVLFLTSMAAKMPTMARTTRSSISVKPLVFIAIPSIVDRMPS